MLSHFNLVWLFATPWTVACQAPLSMGFSMQEYWRGLPCPPPGDLSNIRQRGLYILEPKIRTDVACCKDRKTPGQLVGKAWRTADTEWDCSLRLQADWKVLEPRGSDPKKTLVIQGRKMSDIIQELQTKSCDFSMRHLEKGSYGELSFEGAENWGTSGGERTLRRLEGHGRSEPCHQYLPQNSWAPLQSLGTPFSPK